MLRAERIGASMEERTGHSRRLRLLLKAERNRRGWSLEKTAKLVAKEAGLGKLSKEALRLWENFERHPPIDSFAAWARVLNHRLIVEVAPADSSRIVCMLSPGVADVARAIQVATPKQKRLIIAMLEQMGVLDD